LLLDLSHQAEVIIVKRLIQGHNNANDEVGVEPRLCDRDHTVAVKTALLPSRPRCRPLPLFAVFGSNYLTFDLAKGTVTAIR